MFRKTDTNPQLDLFAAPGNILPKRAQKKYTDDKAWHNQFFKLVTSQIDEESFRPLFEETKQLIPTSELLHIAVPITLADVVVKLSSIQKSVKLSKNVFVLVHMQSSIWLQSYKFKSVSFQNIS